MKDYKKIALYIALVFIGLTLWNKWQFEHPQKTAAVATQQSKAVTHSNTSSVPGVPTAANSAPTKVKHQVVNTIHHGKLIWVNTDVLRVAIDSLGGNVVESYLKKYPATLHSKQPLQLFNTNSDKIYIAQSGLTGKDGPDTQRGQVTYSSTRSSYTLGNNQNKLTVNLRYQKNGVDFVKSFVFYRNKYVMQVSYKIHNHSSRAWQGNFYTQITHHGVSQHHSMFHMLSFTGAAVSSPSDRYKKISFSDMQDKNYSATHAKGWAAMIQHYFLSAWVPNQKAIYHYYSRSNNDRYTIGMISDTLSVAPGQQLTAGSQLYVGPAIASRLAVIAPNLKLTIDYGWLWFISIILFWVLKHVFDFIGNWGWAIIIVTIMIKACFFFLSAKSYRSMAHMRRLQPKMTQIRERFADDKAAQSKAMMELYRKEKCNPMGGCLPMIVQIPFFIAFYYMISASVELRHAPFMFWIHDLSIPDPYYILPIIMGASMFLQQRLNPPAPDPMQQKVMMFLPLIFTVVFVNFPAGLVLYWITNNVVSIAQQYWITRQVERQENKDRGHSKKR